MLYHLIKFEGKCYAQKPGIYILLLFYFVLGILIGQSALLSFPNVQLNAPYSIHFIISLLTLTAILPIVIISAQSLLRELDSSFNHLLYTTIVQKEKLIGSRVVIILSATTLAFALLILGYILGHHLNPAIERNLFSIWPYLQSYSLFILPNIFFITAVITATALFSKKKVMIYITGILLYVLYMVTAIYSNSPLIANSSPISADTMAWAARLDPLGISAFHEQTYHWSNDQRNFQLLSFSGNLLLNRCFYFIFSLTLLYTSFHTYSFSSSTKKSEKQKVAGISKVPYDPIITANASPAYDWKYTLSCILKLARLDFQYLIRGKAIWIILSLLTFYLSMSIYGTLDAGMRIPQYFATTSLMFNEISATLPILLIVITIFLCNELLWKNKSTKFDQLQYVTPLQSMSIIFSKIIALNFIPFIMISLCIAIGILFQLSYSNIVIDWKLYSSLFYYIGCPIVLCTILIVSLQYVTNNKYIGMLSSLTVIIATNTPIGKVVGLRSPLCRLANTLNGHHSEMNGLGFLKDVFHMNVLYSFGIIGIVIVITLSNFNYPGVRIKKNKWPVKLILPFLLVSTVSASSLISNYSKSSPKATQYLQEQYEIEFKKLRNDPLLTITDVKSTIDLYPSKNSYKVCGSYTLVNKTPQIIDQILINTEPNINWQKISLEANNSIIDSVVSIAQLHQFAIPIQPGDTTRLSFEFSYKLKKVNGHHSFNAIVKNGSFLRLSKYFPTLGYQPENEIKNSAERQKRNLGEREALRKLEAPLTTPYNYEFINLSTTISTEIDQIVSGTGTLMEEYVDQKRRYFRFEASDIPFRFACSSAKYAKYHSFYNDIDIEILVHQQHQTNVEHLSQRIKKSLQYCQDNFGAYPHKKISFVEISNFTEGFSATAYPGTIYMTERAFHVDIKDGGNQDIINQVAGHELAHQWWGTSQIAPDYREGRTVLTETLANYIELMLYKEQHGPQKMEELVNLYRELFESEKGFSLDEPLYRCHPNNHNVAYNKGAIVMYDLYLLIGEEAINRGLKGLFQKHKYPNSPPTTLDLIDEILSSNPKDVHSKIKRLFME